MNALDSLLGSPILLVHVAAASFALVLGPFNILRRARDRTHRRVGRVWAVAMVVTAVTSFGIQHPFTAFSWLHALSAWTLISLTLGILAIRRHNVRGHRANMVGSYLGLCVAFLFAAFVPTRTISQVAAAAPLTLVVSAAVVVLSAVATWYVLGRGTTKAAPSERVRPST